MYTWIERRKANLERLQETMQRAQSDFFPKLQRAPGFSSFHLVADQANGINTAIIIWESKAQADAFTEDNSAWMQTLEQFGHTLQSDNRGETVINLAPEG
jgi:heme-degrading monooxygenase HmoA